MNISLADKDKKKHRTQKNGLSDISRKLRAIYHISSNYLYDTNQVQITCIRCYSNHFITIPSIIVEWTLHKQGSVS